MDEASSINDIASKPVPLNNMASSRFANLSDDDMQKLLNGRLSTCTKDVIKTALSTLHAYAQSKGENLNEVECFSVENLSSFLGRFYAELRKTDGSLYARNSLLTIRYGLQQHFKKLSKIDIITDNEFQSANSIFAAVLVHLKHEGKGRGLLLIRNQSPQMTSANYTSLTYWTFQTRLVSKTRSS